MDRPPPGWAICNGSNGTPDLRSRFVVGAGSSYNVGATGGSDSVTLTEAQIPSHKHDLVVGASVQLSGNPVSQTQTTNMILNHYLFEPYAPNYSTLTESAAILSTGSGSSHENRPPYYALYYIMKL